MNAIPRYGLILLGLLSLGWGLNWPILKVVIREIPPWIFRGDCIVLSALGLFAIAAYSKQSIAAPRRAWPQIVKLALCNIVGWNMFCIYGVSLMPSGRAAILGYTMPLWSVPLSIWLLREDFTWQRALGLLLGMSGMMLLIGAENDVLGQAPLGAICMLIASIFWAGGTVLYKYDQTSVPVISLTAWQALIGGIPIALFGHLTETVEWRAISFWPMFGFWYNVFIGLLFCYWAWNRLIQMAPVAVCSLGVLIVPVIGVFSGMLFLGETPHWQDFAALALVLVAIATVLLPSQRPA